jgi:O-antigen/teichoic acid export membrane protein
MASNETHGIATRAVRAMFWAYGSFVGARVLSLLATAVLARLLTPEDFGLVALALIAIAFLDMFPGLGVGDALVVAADDEVEEQAETAFVVSVVVGFGFGVVLAALGPIASSFFEQPELVAIMPVLGISFFVRGFAGTHAALAQKRLDFRSRTAAEMADAITRGLVSVFLAFAGAGVWSLVVGYVVGSAAWAICLWLLVAWRPRLRPRRAHLRRLLGFGGTLTAVGVMGAFLTQFDYVVVGRVLGATELGFYSMATRIPELFILGLAGIAGRVLFPAFASLGDEAVPRAFLASLRYATLVALPLTVFLAVLAEPITLALLGDQWTPSVGAMQVLCLWVAAATLGQVCGNVFKGRGRVDLILMLAVPQAVALVVGSLAVVDRGIVAVACVQAGLAVCGLSAALAIARRLFKLSAFALFDAVRPAVLGAGALAVSLVIIARTLDSPWPTILVGAGVGSVAYIGLVMRLAPDSLTTLKALAFPSSTTSDAQDVVVQEAVDAIEKSARTP